ncbi:MAG: glycosyltransferase [Leeuwenhoekiella sp.]
MNKLAIIIPAYRGEFLKETLDSIAKQTCTDFTLYIGDDCSPDDLFKIVEPFKKQMDIVFTRFDQNLGGSDLVAQWERCIGVTAGEEWLWLFSDDDIMEEDCVQNLYNNLKVNTDVFHFNIDIIDENSDKIDEPATFPEHIEINNYFSQRICYEVKSTVVEYVFSREVYDREGGFENFDLAWCADDATWLRFGRKKGIRTIPGSKVKWRYSGRNISSRIHECALVARKIKSTASYLNWVKKYFEEHGISDISTEDDKIKWGVASILEAEPMKLQTRYEYLNQFLDELEFSGNRTSVRSKFMWWLLKLNTVQFLKDKGIF